MIFVKSFFRSDNLSRLLCQVKEGFDFFKFFPVFFLLAEICLKLMFRFQFCLLLTVEMKQILETSQILCCESENQRNIRKNIEILRLLMPKVPTTFSHRYSAKQETKPQ